MKQPSTDNINQPDDNDDLLAELLTHADVRRQPSDDARAHAFEALHDQWRGQVALRRSRHHAIAWAAAASLVIALVVLFGGQTAPQPTVAVAGVAHLIGGNVQIEDAARSNTRTLGAADAIRAGDTLRSGPGSRVALAWHGGGSLRLDENTAVEFTSANNVRLISGAAYYDSDPANPSDGPALGIQTIAGPVRHIGTQFMLEQGPQKVTLSVREGRAQITTDSATHIVRAGGQLDASTDSVSALRPVAAHAEAWRWVATVAPAFAVDNANAHQLVEWIGRETGRRVVYSNDAERIAHNAPLVGFAAQAPTDGTLAALALATDLQIDVTSDQIVVTTGIESR